MGLLNDFVGDVASDVLSAVSERLSSTAAINLIETCCQELGWAIDERSSPSTIGLYFNDPVIRTRTVQVSVIDRGTMVRFGVGSAVIMTANEIPANVLGYMLERNCGRFTGWYVHVRDDGSAVFGVDYRALMPGLNPGVFRIICQVLLQEASKFDEKMRQAGLL